MLFRQITTTRLRPLEREWKRPLNRYRGPIPPGMALSHMLVESNGVVDPNLKDAVQRKLGIMQVPSRIGKKFGYAEVKMREPEINIFLWCKYANEHSEYLHETYPNNWSQPDYDFWLGVRAIFVTGRKTLVNLFTTSGATTIAGVQAWIRNTMTPEMRFGHFNRNSLRKLADHLDEVKNAMVTLSGANKVSDHFSVKSIVPPGGNEEGLLRNTNTAV